jgi:YidC/Oxa1 family membrane protein insertase
MDRNSLIGWILMGLLMVAMFYTMQQQRQDAMEEAVRTEDTREYEGDTAVDDSRETATEDIREMRPAAEEVAFTDPDESVLSDSARQALDGEISRRKGAFAPYYTGENEQIVVENDVLEIVFNSYGGRPDTVILKEYETWDQQPLKVFTTEKGELDISFSAYTTDGQTSAFNTKDLYFDASKEEGADGESVVRFRADLGSGRYYEHEFIIPATGYLIDFNINTAGFDELINRRDDYFDIEFSQRYESLENNIPSERMYSSLSYANSEYAVERMGLRKSGSKDANYSLKWVSFKQKFFSSVLITDDKFEEAKKLEVVVPDEKEYVKDALAEVSFIYDDGATFQFPMHFYFGPNKHKVLKSMDINLQKTLQLGSSVIRWVNLGIIIPMFNFLNRWVDNYGIIILLLTFFIKIIVFPFTYRSYLSMIKMRVLQPELTELRAKFGKDQQKMGAAQMDLYRKAGVNPLGGCLPMLFQFPILIAMYRFFPASIELRQESFLWAHDLSTFDAIVTWSQHIPFLSDIYGNHISLFTILMAITSFFYTRLNSMNTPTADPSNPMAQQMKMFQYIMPFMLLFIFNKFSAALSYYYFLFNLISVIQQFLMKKFLIDEDKIHAEIQANKKKVRKKSKWQMRMEEMMKQQQEQKKRRR